MAKQRVFPGKGGETPPPSPVSRRCWDTFAARDRDGETLTAVRHYPAREAQWG